MDPIKTPQKQFSFPSDVLHSAWHVLAELAPAGPWVSVFLSRSSGWPEHCMSRTSVFCVRLHFHFSGRGAPWFCLQLCLCLLFLSHRRESGCDSAKSLGASQMLGGTKIPGSWWLVGNITESFLSSKLHRKFIEYFCRRIFLSAVSTQVSLFFKAMRWFEKVTL